MKSLIQIILLIISLPYYFLLCDGAANKLRRYKLCNGSRCKSVRSFNPPNVVFDIDSFMYSDWTRWSPCTRHCTTKRYRACRFPRMCEKTVLHEEAFCYHRGTQCEYIFQNNQRDFLASHDSFSDYYNSDYVEQQQGSDYGGFVSSQEGLTYLSPQSLLTRITSSENSSPTRTSGSRRSSSYARNNRGSFINTNNNYGGGSSISNSNSNSNFRNRQNRTDNRYPLVTLPPPTSQQQNYNDDTRSSTRLTNYNNNYNTNPPLPLSWDSERTSWNVEAEENNLNLHSAPSDTCGVARITDRNRNGISLRILGGRESRRGRWPWQVAILNRLGEAFCGGTLISDRWILTAAHCVRRRIQVTIGEHHLHRNEGTEKHYKINTAFVHPNFNPETVDNDIALLLLPESVPTEAGLACLPEEAGLLPDSDTLCTILGWGKERHTHVFGTSVLHEAKVPIVSNTECRNTYGPYEITNNMFCAGYRDGNVDSCAGDSGGPILCSIDSRWTIFGVTSFGDGCGRQGKYGIYAKVPNYVSWVKKVILANEFL